MSRTKPGEFCWIDLNATDLDGQSAFYEGLLGWEREDLPTDTGPIYRMFRLDGQVVAAASAMRPEMIEAGVPSFWNTYIASDDVDALAARAVELGGQVAMPPMDVMDQGRMVALMDPGGATFFGWKAGVHRGAEVFMTTGAMSWNDLNTRDPQKAIDFYSALFGWKIEKLDAGPGDYWQISVDGVGEGGIMPMPEMMPAEAPDNWLVYFGSDDVGAGAQRVRTLGGMVLVEPMEIPGMLVFAVCSDPAGAVFALLKGLVP